MQRYKLRVTFVEALLGSVPLNAEVYTDYIATKAAKVGNANGNVATEVMTIEAADVKGRTGFHRDEYGNPLLMNYVIKGFAKEACGANRLVPGSKSSALKAYKSKIDALVFVEPRYIKLNVTNPQAVGVLERPLRAETMQGPRVTLASSEMVPANTYFDCTLTVLAPEIITEELLREWMDYGQFMGFGQWRGGGNGVFKYVLKRLDDHA